MLKKLNLIKRRSYMNNIPGKSFLSLSVLLFSLLSLCGCTTSSETYEKGYVEGYDEAYEQGYEDGFNSGIEEALHGERFEEKFYEELGDRFYDDVIEEMIFENYLTSFEIVDMALSNEDYQILEKLEEYFLPECIYGDYVADLSTMMLHSTSSECFSKIDKKNLFIFFTNSDDFLNDNTKYQKCSCIE